MEVQTTLKRNYSITNIIDEDHIVNGRCPNYALIWRREENNPYWSNGHNYYMGNGTNINDGSQLVREILSERLENEIISKYLVFCDLDGVLADFEQGIKNKFNKNVDEINPSLMWGVINKSKSFFETLPWMPKGKELWEKIREYKPIILTGVPPGSATAVQQKINWCQRELGPDIKVITCLTKEKPNYCMPYSILIDDRIDNLKAWNDKGGKFILYKEDDLKSIIERIDRHMYRDLPSP
jgi:hypothetical protein